MRLSPANAHDQDGPTAPARKAFALPNVMTAVRSGDFEAVTTYGIGLAKRTHVDVFTLRGPSRVVVDIGAAFRTVDRKVYFFNEKRYLANKEPYDGVARVRLTGRCSSGGSTVTAAGEIMPTLRRLGPVDWVKVYDPDGDTERPTGRTDSIPECLEP